MTDSEESTEEETVEEAREQSPIHGELVIPLTDGTPEQVLDRVLEKQIESLEDTDDIVQNIKEARLLLSENAKDNTLNPDQRIRILKHFSSDGILSAQHQTMRRTLDVQPRIEIPSDEDMDDCLEE